MLVGVVEVLDAEQLLDVVRALFGDGHAALLLVDLVVDVGPQLRNDPIDAVVELRLDLGRARDDQRRPRLIDEDRVDLIHDRVAEGPLDAILEAKLHVVAEEVEAELVVGAVGDIRAIGRLSVGVLHVVLNAADLEAEEPIDRAHPLRVASREVVVDGDDVNALVLERVEVGRQRGDERLALTRRHLGDRAAMQRDPADQLHVVVAHAGRSTGGFADGGEGLHQQVVERGALLESLPELCGLGAQFVVREGLVGGLELAYGRNKRLVESLELALGMGTDELGENAIQHGPAERGERRSSGVRVAPSGRVGHGPTPRPGDHRSSRLKGGKTRQRRRGRVSAGANPRLRTSKS